MVGTIIYEVSTIICNICIINMRFYLLEVWYPYEYYRITPFYLFITFPKFWIWTIYLIIWKNYYDFSIPSKLGVKLNKLENSTHAKYD